MSKLGRIFKVCERADIICESVDTRYGFKHVAKLFINGYEKDKAKVCYYNRTWEAYEFDTVIKMLLEKTDLLTDAEKTAFRKTHFR